MDIYRVLDPDVVDPHVAAALRAAYGQGYTDALAEDARGERDKLMREYGLRSFIPT